jgi:hypothetical protein
MAPAMAKAQLRFGQSPSWRAFMSIGYSLLECQSQ